MKVAREEIIKLAMKAHINGQYNLSNRLRYVASIMNTDDSLKDTIDFRKIDRIEKSLLLTLEEISG